MLAGLRRLVSSSEVARTSLSSLLIIFVRVAGTAVTFAYTFLIARTMSPDDVGLVWAIWSSSFIASTFTNLNIGSGAIRELVHARARGENAVAAGFVIASRWVLLAVSPFVMLAYLGFCYFNDPVHMAAHWPAYVLAALSLPILGWVQVNASQAAALGQALHSQAPRELVRPFLFLLAFGVALLVGFRPSVEFAILVYLVATVATAVLQFRLLLPAFGFMREAKPATEHWRQWVATGLFLTPTRIIGEHLKNLMIVCAAVGLSASDTARFAIALSLVSFLNFGISAVDMTFSPKISSAMAASNPRRRDSMLAVSCLLKLFPIAAACLVMAAVARPVLALFGQTYVEAADATLWLLLMPLAKAIFGPTELILQVSGKRFLVFATTLVGIVGIAAATWVGGTYYGLTAAAAAASVAYALLQIVQWLVALLLLGVDTSVVNAWKVIGQRLAERTRVKRESA